MLNNLKSSHPQQLKLLLASTNFTQKSSASAENSSVTAITSTQLSEAYIRVIDEVKAKSGLGLNGDPLMNQAFGCDKQAPVIQLNTLQSDAERDEQKGIMFLFKGTVGLRNSKAHSNTLFNDPSRAHEYLALASLLMRLFESAKKSGAVIHEQSAHNEG